MAENPFASRIVGEGTEEPAALLANPFNFRRHPKSQIDALEGALEEIGWIQRVIVNKTTGHMVDGHARVELALRREEPNVPVLYVELSEEQEKIALATFDPIGSLAFHDDEQLTELVRSVSADNDALAEFLDTLNKAEAERDDTPPDDFPEADEDIDTDHECPKCGYKWSGTA